MASGRMDGKGRVTIPRSVRERLGLNPGDVYFTAVVDGELRITPARDPYAHLTGEDLMQADAVWVREHLDEVGSTPARDPYAHLTSEELMLADAAWVREHPEEVRSVREEMEAWDSANLDNLEPEVWDDATRAPRTR